MRLLLIGAIIAALSAESRADAPAFSADELDKTQDPCVDFDAFVNGKWKQQTPIPDSEALWSATKEMELRTQNTLRGLLEAKAAKPGPRGSAAQKVGDFYATAMDIAAIDKAGMEPLAADLAKIEAMQSLQELPALLGYFHRLNLPFLFATAVAPSPIDSMHYLLSVEPGGLAAGRVGLYRNTGAQADELRDKYKAFIRTMLVLAGAKIVDATKDASAILALEMQLASGYLPPAEARKPENLYRLTTAAEAEKLTPAFHWTTFLKALAVDPKQSYSLTPESFFSAMQMALTTVPLAEWKAYLRFQLLNTSTRSTPFIEAKIAFFLRTLEQRREDPPRWQRIQGMMNDKLGALVSQVYIANSFPPAAKKEAQALMEQVRSSVDDTLQAVPWLSASTRSAAREKLQKMRMRVAYPDHWPDFTKLTMRRDSFIANIRRADTFLAQQRFERVGKTVDRNEWTRPPHRVSGNAADDNVITMAAGIFQPPAFFPGGDKALNFGAVGVVVAHEFTHGFDDVGRHFDSDGNLKDWWSAADAEEFQRRSQRLVEQFNGYTVLNGIAVNGALTLGENIADLGGLKIAFHAMRKHFAAFPHEDVTVAGYTSAQRFFISFARILREAMREDFLRDYVATNPHTPTPHRVNGAVRNTPEFAEAFACPRRDMIGIW